MNCIPKIIHYCWFGPKVKSKDEVRCIETWKHKLPDYEIREWNEASFDITEAPLYVQQAYAAKKYAFVSDYVRLKALYENGGIYFDTDIEVIKPFHDCLEDCRLVLAFETEKLLMTAFIACEKKHPFIKQFLDSYDKRVFINPDGSYDTTPNTDLWSPQAAEWGVDLTNNTLQKLENGIKVFPIDVFTGFDVSNWHERVTENTRTVHHMAFSWASSRTRRKNKLIHCIQRIVGFNNYDIIKKLITCKMRRTDG